MASILKFLAAFPAIRHPLVSHTAVIVKRASEASGILTLFLLVLVLLLVLVNGREDEYGGRCRVWLTLATSATRGVEYGRRAAQGTIRSHVHTRPTDEDRLPDG